MHFNNNFIFLFQEFSDTLVIVTKLGDPRHAFLLYFPLAFFINANLGFKILLAAVCTEWLNMELKWLVFFLYFIKCIAVVLKLFNNKLCDGLPIFLGIICG